jgi:hypothetical protein
MRRQGARRKTLLELSERKEFAFAGFNFGEAPGEDFFVPARRFQFVRLGGHRTPEKFHRLQPFSKAHALNLRIPKTNTLPAMSNAQEGSGTTLPPTPIE